MFRRSRLPKAGLPSFGQVRLLEKSYFKTESIFLSNKAIEISEEKVSSRAACFKVCTMSFLCENQLENQGTLVFRVHKGRT